MAEETEQKMTSKEFGQLLWIECQDIAHRFSGRLFPEIARAKITFEAEGPAFAEILYLTLWAISKVLRPDGKALNELHQIFFGIAFNAAREGAALADPASAASIAQEAVSRVQSELRSRYEEYYEAWDKHSYPLSLMILSHKALAKIVGKPPSEKQLMDMRLMMPIQMHVADVMKTIAKTRRKIVLSD